MGYKIMRTDTPSPMFLNQDLKTCSSDGYIWKKYESARNVSLTFVDGPTVIVEDISEERADTPELVKGFVRVSTDGPYLYNLTDRLRASAGEASSVVKKLLAVKELLTEEQSREDRITSDILHLIELEKLPANKLMKLTKDLKECRIRRRKIKDALYIISKLEQGGVIEGITSINDTFTKLDNRSYDCKEYTVPF